MNIRETVTFPAPTIPPINLPGTVRATLGFFDPPMVEYFKLDIPSDGTWKGDFDHTNLTVRFPNGGTQSNAIAQWWELTEEDMEFLWQIQPKDDDIYTNATLNNKKNWHLNTATDGPPERPIWFKNGKYRYGTMSYGHSSIRVDGHDRFVCTFPGGQRENADFVKVVGMKRSMMKPMGEYIDHVVEFKGVDGITRKYSTRLRSEVIPLIEAGIVQICTEPNTARKISITNKGIKTMFVPGADFIQQPAGEYFLWQGALV